MYRLVVVGCLIVSCWIKSAAQNDYYMSNSTTYDCKGNFYDSDNGIKFGDYAHNEDLIFRICVKNAEKITLVFQNFCTEKLEDYLIIYDGGDTTAKKLSGKISGTKNPGTFTSSDSCLTIYFHSDASVACDGWKAHWTTKVKPLPDPGFKSPAVAHCEDGKVGVRFDQKFGCDSLSPSNFSITGKVNPNITKVTPVNCVNGETDSFQLTLSTPLNRSGVYTISFDGVKYDECDSAWMLHADTTFAITDCPIYVELFADPDTICLGSCTQIIADVSGGDSLKYVFNWTPNISGTYGPNSFCPKKSGWLQLSVSDGSEQGSDSIWIEVVDPPAARSDTSVCQSANPFKLTATPSGGYWTGRGITDSDSGLYDPYLAGAGKDTARYWFAGCSDDVIISVKAIDAGKPNAACPGTASFALTNYTPVGGTWSGAHVQSNGVFNPVDTGSFILTYSWNGCTDTKTVNVYPIETDDFDTTCQSTPELQLSFSPVGGNWAGVGFTDYSNGLFYPPRAGAGNKTLIYSVNGCKDTTQVLVVSINARGNQIACPDAPPFNLLPGIPAGGVWKGTGVTDSINGIYDASFIYALKRTWFNDTLTYSVNGCVANKIMYIRQTVVPVDSLKFCIEHDSILLDYNSTLRSPSGGVWTGNGVQNSWFNPVIAGHGFHILYYDAYGCRDSLVAQIFPAVVIQTDTTVCVTDNPFILKNDATGGTWAGKGTDNLSGNFNPFAAGIGFHKIFHNSVNGCLDSLVIEVQARPVVSISRFDPFYCFKDSLYLVQGTPSPGTLTGIALTDSFFNPATAGTGKHQLRYQFGTPTCWSADSVIVEVGDTLFGKIDIDDDSLCDGEYAILTATAIRGLGSNYAYSWSTDPSTSRSLIQQPSSSAWVHAVFSDGCSDVFKDSVFINVFPKVEFTAKSSPVQCYGTTGTAEVWSKFEDPFSVTWFTTPFRYTNQISVPVSNTYRFRIKNLNTGCSADSSVTVLSYPRIKAHFITNPPEGRCLNPFNPTLYVINFTEGAVDGIWDFGDGNTEVYQQAINPVHVYRHDTSWFRIALRVSNEGGCVDSFFSEVCLDDSVFLMIPSAFSPGTDGINDGFSVRTAGIDDFEIIIFDRWGEQVFRSNDVDFRWDGRYLNRDLPIGTYGYLVSFKGKHTIRKQQYGTLLLMR
ncbi:MAG: T9SS type B sorting domain-containing protein [Bacteroidetes bacterium]|nr:T9SS type B sorting domain-containing protein [Bacteroidota bacterium]